MEDFRQLGIFLRLFAQGMNETSQAGPFRALQFQVVL